MATKLSPAMREAMGKLTREFKSALELQLRLRTLWALDTKGLAEHCRSRNSLSRWYPERATIKWRLAERGEEWKAS